MPQSYVVACAEQGKSKSFQEMVNKGNALPGGLKELALEHGKKFVLETVAKGKALFFSQGSLRTVFSPNDYIPLSYALMAMEVSHYSISYHSNGTVAEYKFDDDIIADLNAHQQAWQAKQAGHGI